MRERTGLSTIRWRGSALGIGRTNGRDFVAIWQRGGLDSEARGNPQGHNMLKWVIILVTISLIAIHMVFGAAATLCLGVLFAILFHCRDMIWAANRRNERERYEFAQVNNGHAEPDPEFLTRVWDAR